MLEHLGSTPVISCEEFDRCLAVWWTLLQAQFSITFRIQDRNSEIRVYTPGRFLKLQKLKSRKGSSRPPVSTPNAPADDPCQLPTATFALRKSFSLKNNLQRSLSGISFKNLLQLSLSRITLKITLNKF